MKEKAKKVIKIIFGTEDAIKLKFSLSCLLTGILFFLFSIAFQETGNKQPTILFTYISGTFSAFWLVTITDRVTIEEICYELLRLGTFFLSIIFSLNFCLNLSPNYDGFELFIYSIFSCIGIFFSLFYLMSKFIDILKFAKDLCKHIKDKMYDSIQPAQTKLMSLIENITAFFVAIAGLAVAIKTIVEPLIGLIK